MKFVSSLFAGLLFGYGLVLSGMTDPSIVIAFLDIGGDWNPALAFTMGGAIAVAAPAFWFARRRSRAASQARSATFSAQRVDAALVTGSAIFGIGWGLSGVCPGPGLILVTGGAAHALIFVTALLIGIAAARRVRPGAAHAGRARADVQAGAR